MKKASVVEVLGVWIQCSIEKLFHFFRGKNLSRLGKELETKKQYLLISTSYICEENIQFLFHQLLPLSKISKAFSRISASADGNLRKVSRFNLKATIIKEG